MAPSLSKSGSNATVLVDNLTTPSITLVEPNFTVNDHVFLSQVLPNIVATSSPYSAAGPGCFIGFDTNEASSHHTVPIGKLKNIKSMSIFRFKVWWTTHWTGSNGSDLERETQMLILDKSDERPYILLLPLLEGPFRASLQPGVDDDVAICVESGSTKVTGSSFRAALYMHAGGDPFTLVEDAWDRRQIRVVYFFAAP